MAEVYDMLFATICSCLTQLWIHAYGTISPNGNTQAWNVRTTAANDKIKPNFQITLATTNCHNDNEQSIRTANKKDKS